MQLGVAVTQICLKSRPMKTCSGSLKEMELMRAVSQKARSTENSRPLRVLLNTVNSVSPEDILALPVWFCLSDSGRQSWCLKQQRQV